MTGDKNVMRADGINRRQAIFGAVAAFSSVGASSAGTLARAAEEISHSAEAIHQEPVFKASRKRVYEALTDAKQFNEVTLFSHEMHSGAGSGAKPTEISREVGGAFTLFGGHIVGRHVELVPNERIVQAWRVVDWALGWYSIAKFELVEQGSGTKIVFDHVGFPKGLAQHLLEGWNAHYWDSLQKYLAGAVAAKAGPRFSMAKAAGEQ
jgi:activator of HSP90 ATPase